MKHSKKYRKMMKKYKKELVDIAKKTYPWDYGYITDFIYTQLKFMKAYYKLGENVWGEDKENKRLKQIEKVIKLFDDYNENIMYKYWDFGEMKMKKDGSVDLGMTPLIDLDSHKNTLLEQEEQEKCWNAIFDSLKKNMRDWWD